MAPGRGCLTPLPRAQSVATAAPARRLAILIVVAFVNAGRPVSPSLLAAFLLALPPFSKARFTVLLRRCNFFSHLF